MFTNVEEDAVISAVDVDHIYKIPRLYFEQNLDLWLSVHVSKSILRREHALGHGVGYFEYAAAFYVQETY